MSPDLLDKLHEGAAAQFGESWYMMNKIFVDKAIDARVPTHDYNIKQMLSMCAYSACHLAANVKVDLGCALKLLDLYRSEMFFCLRDPCFGDASIYARKAASQALLILGEIA